MQSTLGTDFACRWAGCKFNAPSWRDRILHEIHDIDHGAVFEEGYGQNPIVMNPLGPKPWQIDLEGSDRPVSITIVAADDTTAFRLGVVSERELLNLDDDERDARWEAGLQLAEKITGSFRDAPAPRMMNDTHVSRYFASIKRWEAKQFQGPVCPPTVACPQCGEERGNPCS